MILCISAFSVVTTPFSFLIVLIWVFFLFFLMSLPIEVYWWSAYWFVNFIFSKKQLLVLLTFDIVSPFLVHLFLLWSLQFLLPFLLFFFQLGNLLILIKLDLKLIIYKRKIGILEGGKDLCGGRGGGICK